MATGPLKEGDEFMQRQTETSPTTRSSGDGSLRRARGSLALVGALALVATAGISSVTAQDADGRVFHTTAGPLTEAEVGDVLAHQHMFVEFGANPPMAFVDADPDKVYEVIGPWVEEARDLGISVFVDPTPLGVGRRPDIVKAVADRAGLPTMMVTGIYREPFQPAWVNDASVEEIADFLREELEVGVGDTDVPAGWIKLSQNATGMTLQERKVLEAACIVAQETGAAIGSHLGEWGGSAGPIALSVLDALDSYGCYWAGRSYVCYHMVRPPEAAEPGREVGTRFDVARAIELAAGEVRFLDLLLDLTVEAGVARWEDEDEVAAALASGLLSAADGAYIERARATLQQGHRQVVREIRWLLRRLGRVPSR